jgi:threonine synthase
MAADARPGLSTGFKGFFIVRYISTRGEAPALKFSEAVLAGLARDGGLYMPETYPQFEPDEIGRFAGLSYAEVATRVIAPFLDDSPAPAEFAAMAADAYATFRHPAVAPLVQIDDNLFVLELFHGPTLAFKDVAMQLLARLMDHVLKARGERATIVGATSGDTGAAAIEAFRGLEQVDVFILFPHGRVSEVQRRQMTGVDAANVHVIAVEGTFDDCQALVKGLFNNLSFRDKLKLSGVNSINWARIVAQTVYYFTSAVALGGADRKVSFTVPTGNFGDVLAGYIAKRMGLPIERLVIATNENDILARTLASGAYELHSVRPTQSPSMDIQVSSNFERLLFDACGRDAAEIRRRMAHLQQSGRFELAESERVAIAAEFDALRTGETGTLEEIANTWRAASYLLDPHSAVAVHAARKILARQPAVPMIVLATAHPAKFPDAVSQATGMRPQLPAHLADLLEREEHVTIMPNDPKAIERFMNERSRAGAPESSSR